MGAIILGQFGAGQVLPLAGDAPAEFKAQKAFVEYMVLSDRAVRLRLNAAPSGEDDRAGHGDRAEHRLHPVG